MKSLEELAAIRDKMRQTVDTREAAQAFIDADPFHQADLFEQVRITRWRKAYVAGTCLL